jgi:hypothetical protein
VLFAVGGYINDSEVLCQQLFKDYSHVVEVLDSNVMRTPVTTPNLILTTPK